ncbi:hypothetical protein [Salinicola halimionae]|uniref:hypothetical protein n=1 Tax=Salinicola halimionae TaxID=1949081 RepID=UPI000DA16BBB|nr:hypothetical protein [Salinicola halimionae]
MANTHSFTIEDTKIDAEKVVSRIQEELGVHAHIGGISSSSSSSTAESGKTEEHSTIRLHYILKEEDDEVEAESKIKAIVEDMKE